MKIVECQTVFEAQKRRGDEDGIPTGHPELLTCTFCNQTYKPGDMICHGTYKPAHWDQDIFVCPHCLERQDPDRTLEQSVKSAEWRAEFLRSLIGRVQLPKFVELEARNEEKNPEVIRLAEKHLVPVRTAAAIYMEGMKKQALDEQIPF